MSTVDVAVVDPAAKATGREDRKSVKCVGLIPGVCDVINARYGLLTSVSSHYACVEDCELKKGMFIVLLLVIVFSVCGCGPNNADRLMASLDGQHISKAVALFGQPNQVLDDGQGGLLVTWTDMQVFMPPRAPSQTAQPCPPGLDPLGYALGQGMGQGIASASRAQGPFTVVSTKVVAIDPNGFVHDWSWQQGSSHRSKAEYEAKWPKEKSGVGGK